MFTCRTALTLSCALAVVWLSGCSMKEEIRRIEEVKKQRQATAAQRSTNLTGAQIFIRTCNECHPQGLKSPLGPSLIDTDKDYPTDEQLKQLIRKGKANMPACTSACLNDQEVASLIVYVRQLNERLRESEKAGS